ncbi:PD-(D/E)XK nuclease family protein [Candidatus Deianiraea vastatrix]|uniref:PD-(D/E)XK nuclease superfamily protein n=1 Tax=Candidatus Deianiraea vastatrix TaxID=2163644 RepID=A0A5B8XDI5_9RICK|nr:PD-(D/E)XK nuclease family protein [Candidatus Deianiraea vastatrix]QED23076.1 PD-(D/E)XK nuclease superfamily protein [Candidatus Deianiraea vastatrix]
MIFIYKNAKILDAYNLITSTHNHDAIIFNNKYLDINDQNTISFCEFIAQNKEFSLVSNEGRLNFILQITKDLTLAKKIISYIENYHKNIVKNTEYEHIIITYSDLLKQSNFIDFDLNIDALLQKALDFVQKSAQKFLFLGIDFAKYFTFFKDIAMLKNVDIVFLNNQHYNDINTEKALEYCGQNDITITNIQNAPHACQCEIIQFATENSKISYITEEITKLQNKKIAVISDDIYNLELFESIIKSKNIACHSGEFLAKVNIINEIAKIAFNKIKFKLYITDFLHKLFPRYKNDINRLQNEIIEKNISSQKKIIAVMKNIFHGNADIENVIQVLGCIQKNGLISEFLNNCNKIYNISEYLELKSYNGIMYKNYNELVEILNILHNEINKKEDISGNVDGINVFILSHEKARFEQFDTIFFLESKTTFTSENQKNKYFVDIANFIDQCSNFIIPTTNNLISIKAFMQAVNIEPKISSYNENNDNTNHSNRTAISDFSSKMPNKISYSAIKLYIDNPYDFYIKYILKLRKQESFANATIGIARHEILQNIANFLNLNKMLDIDDIKAKIKDEILPRYDDNNLNSKILNAEMTDFVDLIYKLLSKILKNGGKIVTEEIYETSIVIDNREIKIIAKPDILAIYDDYFELYDLKTGSNAHKDITISGEISMKNPQLLMYANVISDSLKRPVKDFSYIYFNQDVKYIKSFSQEIDKENILTICEKCNTFITNILQKIYTDGEFINDINETNYWYFAKE